jgi:DNA replication protein DnaC
VTATKKPVVSVGSGVAGPSAQTLEEVIALTRRLRMPYLRKAAVDVVPTARAQRWDPAEVLRVLLAEEITGRDEATLRTRRARANFPAGKTFAVWDETRCSIPAPTQQALRSMEWVDRRENLCVCGPSEAG